MENYKRIYSLIKIIYNHDIDKIKSFHNLFSNILKNALISLLKVYKIKTSKIVILSSKAENCKEFILHGQPQDLSTDFLDVSKINNEYTIYKKTYLFKIKGINYVDEKEILIGVLVLKRDIKLPLSAINVLTYTCSVLGEYLLKRIVLTYEFNFSKNLSNINSFDLERKKPGTLIFRFLHYLNRGLNSSFGFFGIIDGENLTIDYSLKQTRKKAIFNHNLNTFNITSSLIKNINQSTFLYIPQSSQISAYLMQTYKEIDENYSFVVYAIKNDNAPIGIWIMAFSPYEYFSLQKSQILLDHIGHIISKNFNYLFQRKTNKMITNPIFKSRETRQINKAFVLMPFTLEWSDRIWQKIIKPTIKEEIGIEVKRADDLFGQDIMEDIWLEILTSQIVIADITDRNPNVFYELGIAHTLGKNVILLTQKVEDIPFDLNRFRHIIYKDNFDGYEILKNQLIGTIKNILENE